MPAVGPPRQSRELARLIASRASVEGTTLGGFSGVCFFRASSPVRVRKTIVRGPRLLVIGRGRRLARFSHGELVYDEENFLVVTGETHFTTHVIEATPERPYLEMCLELPPDVVARTLLAVVDAATAAPPPASSDIAGSHFAGSHIVSSHIVSSNVASSEAERASHLPAFVSPLAAPLANALVRLVGALDDRVERQVLAPLVLDEIVFRLLRSDGAAVVRSAVREEDAAIQLAMRFMRENATRGLSVEDVARHAGMSASHFAHRFSAIARVSPMRYVKHVRLELARELMLGANVRVGEAAARVGYESASHFTRDFKHAYGAAPAEYVRLFRERDGHR